MKNFLINMGFYHEGYQACQQFLGDECMVHNPYKTDSPEFIAWATGWADALLRLPVMAY
jgi:hypothetical protein